MLRKEEEEGFHVRWFGTPWPNEERRAPICESDEDRVPMETVVGTKCMACSKRITEKDRGVITACTPTLFGCWNLGVGKYIYPVCSYHLLCFLESTVGGEMSSTIANRMRLRPGDVQLTTEEIDEMERKEEAWGDIYEADALEEAERGRGWNRSKNS